MLLTSKWFFFKMISGLSHFTVSLIVGAEPQLGLSIHQHFWREKCFINCGGQATVRLCPQTNTFEEKNKLQWNWTWIKVLSSWLPHCWAKPAELLLVDFREAFPLSFIMLVLLKKDYL